MISNQTSSTGAWRLAVLASLITIAAVYQFTVLSLLLLGLPLVVLIAAPHSVRGRWSWWLVLAGLAGLMAWIPAYRVANAWMPDGAQLAWWPMLVHIWGLCGLAWFPLAAVLWWRDGGWWRRSALIVSAGVLLVLMPNLPWLYRPQWTWPEQLASRSVDRRIHDWSVMTRAGVLPTRQWLPSADPVGVVILVHGVGANQDYLASRARLLTSCGWAVLTCDLPGHGAASPAVVSYGPHEADAVVAWYAACRPLMDPDLPTVMYGMSMGGAIAALAIDRCSGVSGLIIESGYADLGAMIQDTLPPSLAALARMVSVLGIGVDPQSVRPITARWIQEDRPLLLGWGTADGIVGYPHTRAFHNVARSARTCEIQGAVHDELIERHEWRVAVTDALAAWVKSSP